VTLTLIRSIYAFRFSFAQVSGSASRYVCSVKMVYKKVKTVNGSKVNFDLFKRHPV
jgi:hypothetical protein